MDDDVQQAQDLVDQAASQLGDDGDAAVSSATPPAVADEEAVSGSAPTPTADDDVGEMVKEVIGNEPEPGKPFSLADEVEADETALLRGEETEAEE